MRAYLEALELNILAPYATRAADSNGRVYAEFPCPQRTCFQRDRDRIIHAKAFRRLKHKTQVFISTDSDHYRTRLTHTFEVAQLSRHIARMLRLNEDLAEAIALSHDLGHPPFGHSGERALNQLMKPYGGFEHNLQSLRIVDVLEEKYPQFPGLNLSYEVREGLKKHEKNVVKTLEAQVVNLADEIAYNNHDIDDGLTADLLETDQLDALTLWRETRLKIQERHPDIPLAQLRSLINSALISRQISDVVVTTEHNIQRLDIRSAHDIQAHSHPIVSFSDKMKLLNQELRRYLFDHFYSHPTIATMNLHGQQIIHHLFDAFTQDTQHLSKVYQDKINQETPKERVVSDYIAGMTDSFATHTAQTLKF